MDNNQTSRGQGSNTGTRDVTYDLTAVLDHALQGVENCQIYMDDAQGKQEHRQFFQQAMESQKRLAEQAKQLLHDCLMDDTGGNSASGGSMHQQGSNMGSGTTTGGISSTQTHSMDEPREDGSAFRFASGQTEGGSDQFEGGSEQDRQSGLAQGQRSDNGTTGGGGTRSL